MAISPHAQLLRAACQPSSHGARWPRRLRLGGWDWDLSRSEGLRADVDRYVALCARNRRITADVDPNATITTKRGRVMDIRGIMIGMIHEYGRHNGHADIVRELIDGVTGE